MANIKYNVTRTRRMPTKDGYLIPGVLVHRLITGIVVAIITIGGYMVIWGISDAEFKATMLTKMAFLEARVVEIGDDLDKHEDFHDD